MYRFWIACFVGLCTANAQPLTFNPKDPLPGKKEPAPSGPRALVPAALSLSLSVCGAFLGYHVIVKDSKPGRPLPSGSVAVGALISVYPSIGRLLVPQNHTPRSAIFFSSGRLLSVALFYSATVGVSRGARGVAGASFLALSAFDVAGTARLRFPKAGDGGRADLSAFSASNPTPAFSLVTQLSLTPIFLPEQQVGLGLVGKF